jgi:quaternary ammonium compound-resistance protein SugE
MDSPPGPPTSNLNNVMAWLYLLLAGLFEIGFAISIKLMDGHKNLPWTVVFYVCVILSFGFLQEAAKSLPIGTAYAIWTGIGGVGVAIIGMAFLGDPINPWRIAFLLMLVTALVGLKLTAGEH